MLVVRAGRGGDAFSRQTDAIYDAAFRRAGMLRVQSLRELFWAAETLALDLPVRGDRLAILGNSRGLGLLAADMLFTEGGGWPSGVRRPGRPWRTSCRPASRPPIRSIWAWIPIPPCFAAALAILLRRAGTGWRVGAARAERIVTSATDTAAVVIETVQRSRTGCAPWRAGLLAGADSARAARQQFLARAFRSYDTPNDAIRAFMQRWRHQCNQAALMETPPDRPELFSADLAAARELIQAALAADRCALTGAESRSLLTAYGMALASEEPIAAAPAPTGSLALTLRMVQDPTFGPVLLFGPGGPAAVFADEFAAALPPLNPVPGAGRPSSTRRQAGNCKMRRSISSAGWMISRSRWSGSATGS